MRRIVAGVVVLLLAWPVLADDEKPKNKSKEPDKQKPAEKYQALVQEFNDARQAFLKEYREAKTQEERQKVLQEKQPQADKYAAKFIELAEKNAKDPAAVDALAWVVMNTFSLGPDAKSSPRAKALAIISRDHVQSDKLGMVCQMLAARGEDKETETLLRKILNKNPHKEVQGPACLGLAQILKKRAEGMPETNAKAIEKVQQESEKLYERVVKNYADVNGFRGTLGDQAKNELFEMQHLSRGKPAPDIAAEDLDGKEFKLSDYKGKVVLLDFWGNW
jgi:hypothetical protein